MTITQAVEKTVDTLLRVHTAKRVTCIVSPTLSVCATRRFKYSPRNTREDLALTIGRPNYRSRQLIKLAKKAGEPFPIKKLQLQAAR
jgi:hypothetical protein